MTEINNANVSDNNLYLTVSYHRESDALTTINKIFRVSWN